MGSVTRRIRRTLNGRPKGAHGSGSKGRQPSGLNGHALKCRERAIELAYRHAIAAGLPKIPGLIERMDRKVRRTFLRGWSRQSDVQRGGEE